MRLLLIRHAVTGETGSVLTGRLPGVGLSEAGVEMARNAGRHLAGAKLDVLYTSPIQRCRETAKHIGAETGHRPKVDRRFQEVDFGRWAGRKLGDLVKLKAWRGLFASASRFRFPDGETLHEVQTRAVGGIEDLAVRHRDATVGVVSHADVIRVAACHYLGMPLDLVHRLDVLPASVTVIHLPKVGPPAVPVLNHVDEIGRWR